MRICDIVAVIRSCLLLAWSLVYSQQHWWLPVNELNAFYRYVYHLCHYHYCHYHYCEVRAFQYRSCTLSFWPWYCLGLLMHSQPGEGSLPDSYKNVWILFLNGLESLVFATKIIPQLNYLTRQMLGFLGLYKDQNIVFIIFYLTLLTAVLWS